MVFGTIGCKFESCLAFMNIKIVKHRVERFYKLVIRCDCGKNIVIPLEDCLLPAPDDRRLCLHTDRYDIEIQKEV